MSEIGHNGIGPGWTWTCEKCGAVLREHQLKEHAAMHAAAPQQMTKTNDLPSPPPGPVVEPPIDQTRYPTPNETTEAALFHLLIACGVTLEGTDTQERLRQAYQNINERFTKARESDGLRERIAYLEELNRRLEKYAAFEAVGSIGNADGLIVIECQNCSHRRRMPVGTYEVLQRQTHERNSRIDL